MDEFMAQHQDPGDRGGDGMSVFTCLHPMRGDPADGGHTLEEAIGRQGGALVCLAGPCGAATRYWDELLSTHSERGSELWLDVNGWRRLVNPIRSVRHRIAAALDSGEQVVRVWYREDVVVGLAIEAAAREENLDGNPGG